MSDACEDEHPDGFTCELPRHGPDRLHAARDEKRNRSRYWSSDKLTPKRTTWRSDV